MRVMIAKESLFLLKKTIEASARVSSFADETGVNRRTLSGWLSGETTIPEEEFVKIISKLKIKKNSLDFELLDDFWNNHEAAVMGGKKRSKSFALLGTIESRRLGGINSQATHKKNRTAFYNRKKIRRPRRSEILAELMGILFGDGHLDKFQVLFTTNSETDHQHALFVAGLFDKLFGVKPVISKRKDVKCVQIVCSSIELVSCINALGMPIGNKLSHGLVIPDWINSNNIYSRAFLRGVFDTDGSVYLDKHLLNGKQYCYCSLAFSSASNHFLDQLMGILKNNGVFGTKSKSQKLIYIRKRSEVIKYFKIIKSSNEKHKQRYSQFIGEVPKRS